jgi:uncharacterized protein (TIGR03437 family)
MDSALTWEYNIIYSAATNDPNKQCLEAGVMVSCGVPDFLNTVADVHSFFTVRSQFVISEAIADGYQPAGGAPQVTAGGITAYGGAQAVSPGGLTTITGSNLSTASATESGSPLPRIVGNNFVAVDGVRAPLVTTSDGSIAVQIPGDIAPSGLASVVVFSNGNYSDTQLVTVQAATPSVVAVMHQDGSAVSASSPIVPGETLTVYATGLGVVNGNLPIGNTPYNNSFTTTATPQLMAGSQSLSVTYSGLAPSAVGLYQINALAPASLPANASSVTLVFQ